MTDDDEFKPLPFAEWVMICRCRPVGDYVASIELTDYLIDEHVYFAEERYPGYPLDDDLYDAMAATKLALDLAGPGGEDPDDDGWGGRQRVRPLAPAGAA
jgi:hypothetical protein